MSRFGLSPRLGAATLFLAAGLQAQDKPADVPKPESMMNASMSSRAQDIMKRFDKNGDGRIDEDERADAQDTMMKERLEKQPIRIVSATDAALRARLLERFDRDRNGQLDEEERATAQKIAEDLATDPVMVALRAEVLKRFDQNTNGKIEGDEAVALREFVAVRSALLANATPDLALRRDLAKRLDRNTDGRVDDAEMAAAAEGLRLGLSVAAFRGDQFDVNRDGMLNEEEWNSAQQQLQRWLNGEVPLLRAPAPQNDQQRLNAVTAEVERRRLLREGLGPTPGSPPSSAITVFRSDGIVTVPLAPEAEKARLEAIAAEVAKRRAEREAAATIPAK